RSMIQSGMSPSQSHGDSVSGLYGNRKASRTSTQKTEPASTPQMRSPPPPPGPDDAQPDARTTTIAASTRSSPTWPSVSLTYLSTRSEYRYAESRRGGDVKVACEQKMRTTLPQRPA